jgi:hypothetical protein
MQVHNSEASQVLFSFNRWGGNGSPVDVGIGSQPSGNPDWTFSYNAGNYTERNLQVYVLTDKPVIQTFKILTAQRSTPGQFTLTWEAKSGVTYSILKKSSLSAATWTKAGEISATSDLASFTDTQASGATSYYLISVP